MLTIAYYCDYHHFPYPTLFDEFFSAIRCLLPVQVSPLGLSKHQHILVLVQVTGQADRQQEVGECPAPLHSHVEHLSQSLGGVFTHPNAWPAGQGIGIIASEDGGSAPARRWGVEALGWSKADNLILILCHFPEIDSPTVFAG